MAHRRSHRPDRLLPRAVVSMKRPRPDNRPDWRDPNMPVLVQHRTDGLISVEPERLQKVANVRLHMCPEPDWHDDPTYDLKKQRKKL